MKSFPQNKRCGVVCIVRIDIWISKTVTETTGESQTAQSSRRVVAGTRLACSLSSWKVGNDRANQVVVNGGVVFIPALAGGNAHRVWFVELASQKFLGKIRA